MDAKNINIVEALSQYESIKEQEKLIKERKEELSKFLKSFAVSKGQQDSKGSSYITEGEFVVGNVASKKITFNQEKALAYITEHKSELVNDIMETVQIVSESKIEALVSKGLLSVDDVEQMVDTKITYRLNIQKEKPEEE